MPIIKRLVGEPQNTSIWLRTQARFRAQQWPTTALLERATKLIDQAHTLIAWSRILDTARIIHRVQNSLRSRDLAAPGFDTAPIINYIKSRSVDCLEGQLDSLVAGLEEYEKNSEELEALGQKIQQRIKDAMRAWRQKELLTQRDMARWLGVSLKNYASYEIRPERDVPIPLIVVFCQKTGTDPLWILYGQEPPTRTSVTRRLQPKRTG